MTTQEIDALIAKRDRIAVRYAYRTHQLDQIDRKLRRVPPGQDNRVDLALGRAEAVLTQRAEYTMRADTVALAEMTRIIFEQAEPIEYT